MAPGPPMSTHGHGNGKASEFKNEISLLRVIPTLTVSICGRFVQIYADILSGIYSEILLVRVDRACAHQMWPYTQQFCRQMTDFMWDGHRRALKINDTISLNQFILHNNFVRHLVNNLSLVIFQFWFCSNSLLRC